MFFVLAIGVLKHLLHQLLFVPVGRLLDSLPLCDGHRDARLLTVLCQPCQRGVMALLLVGDALRIVVCLREVELEDDLLTAIEVTV